MRDGERLDGAGQGWAPGHRGATNLHCAGGSMKSNHALLAISTLALTVTLAGCDDLTRPGQSASPAVAAHDPTRHGGGSAVVISALPDYTTAESADAAASGGALKLAADVAGDIPRHADSYISTVAVFGYAWAAPGT